MPVGIVHTGLQLATASTTMCTGWRPTVPDPVVNVVAPTNTGQHVLYVKEVVTYLI